MEDFYVPAPTKPKPRKPTKEFGEAAYSLAIDRWGTQAAILKEMGYKPDSKNETLRRLRRGDGSDESARALYAALKRDGVDVSKLPPIYPDDEDSEEREQTWRQEWAWIGEMLHGHAPGLYEQTVDELRVLARAIARRAGQSTEIFRAT